MPLLSLPLDVLIHLLSTVDGYSLMTCREVCKTFSTLIEKDIGLRYKLELYRSGMIDHSSKKYAGVPLSRRLGQLKQLNSRRQSWSTTWPEGLIPGTRSKRNIEDWSWEYSPKVLACLTTDSDVHIFEFLGLESTVPYNHRVLHPELRLQFGLIHGLFLDPRQDLLILIDCIDNQGGTECRVHVLSLCDGLAHPRATKHIIKVCEDPAGLFQTEISGNLVAVGVLHDDTPVRRRIRIFDWMTGEQKATFCGSTFMFLDSQHVLVGYVNDTLSRGELQIYAIGRSHPLFILPIPTYSPYSLHFERDFQDGFLTASKCDTSRYPFGTDPALKMITLCLIATPPNTWRMTCAFPMSSILTLLDNEAHINDASRSPIEIPWGTWPQCMVIWPMMIPDVYVSGYRIAISHTDKSETTHIVLIYRFQPEWFQQKMILREVPVTIGDDLSYSDLAPIGTDHLVTLPLPKPEHVITTGDVTRIWMDDDLLIMALPEGIRFLRA